MGVKVIVAEGVVVGVRVTVGVVVWVGVEVLMGMEVGVCEGARVWVLVKDGFAVGVKGEKDKAGPLHPVRSASIKMNKRTIKLLSGRDLFSIHLQNILPAGRGGRNRPIIYRKWGDSG